MITIHKLYKDTPMFWWYKINFHSKGQAYVYTSSLTNAKALVELRTGKRCRLIHIPFTKMYVAL